MFLCPLAPFETLHNSEDKTSMLLCLKKAKEDTNKYILTTSEWQEATALTAWWRMLRINK